MKIQGILITLFCATLCFWGQSAHAGFYLHRPQNITIHTVQPDSTESLSNSIFMPEPPARRESGVVAYLAAGAAVLGLLIASTHTLLLVLLLGLFAGVFGAGGLKRYKHNKFYRALCYVGIIGGAICVFLASVPALFFIK